MLSLYALVPTAVLNVIPRLLFLILLTNTSNYKGEDEILKLPLRERFRAWKQQRKEKNLKYEEMRDRHPERHF